jgi:2-C-methyl-D-erythritol 4-phosphate cytidylyltransferase
MKIGVVIVCAGRGKRLGRKIDKAVLKLKRQPLFYHAFKAFKEIKEVKEIVLVLRKVHFRLARKLINTLGRKDKRILIVGGGRERKDSVYNGLKVLEEDITHVLIHDAARPFVTKVLIMRIIKELKSFPAVICGIKSKDTLKLAHKGFVRKTLDRDDIILVQTPQGFRKDLILEAYSKLKIRNTFDDAQVLELSGIKVRIVAGDTSNIKITYPEDIDLAKAFLKSRMRSRA